MLIKINKVLIVNLSSSLNFNFEKKKRRGKAEDRTYTADNRVANALST